MSLSSPTFLTTQIAGEDIWLLPDRAMFWPKAQTRFVTDLHFGKAAAFRAASIALPRGTTTTDLERLTCLIEQTSAARLAILGDVFHARESHAPSTLAAIREWRSWHDSLEILMIRGNHDRRAGDPANDLKFKIVDEGHLESPFVFNHEPENDPQDRGYVLAGHIHPGVRLRRRGRGGGLRLPGFIFRPKHAILPAFGSLTGLAPVSVTTEDRVFVIADDEVIPVT